MSWQPDLVRSTFPPLTGAVRRRGPIPEPTTAAGHAMANIWPLVTLADMAPVPPRNPVLSAHAVVPDAMAGPLSIRTECSTTPWYPEAAVVPVGDP